MLGFLSQAFLYRASMLLGSLMFFAACSGGGQVDFASLNSNYAPPAFNLVPASEALAVEVGKTVDTGYSAKIELNPIQGQRLTSSEGYALRLKSTTRTRQ